MICCSCCEQEVFLEATRQIKTSNYSSCRMRPVLLSLVLGLQVQGLIFKAITELESSGMGLV